MIVAKANPTSRTLLVLWWLALCSGCATRGDPATAIAISDAATPAQAGLVDISTRVPDISLDMRYAGTDNFVGTRVDGYAVGRCYLRERAADALAQVEKAVREQGFRLRIFDCYRPARAVAHFMRWAQDTRDQRTKPQYYPNLDKPALVGEYIARVSGHSRGSTVDLTLLDCRQGDPCLPLDMATDFDFFDVRANTETPGLSEAQRANRQRLLSAMAQHGFRNYEKEWWHFTFSEDPSKALFDVPIE